MARDADGAEADYYTLTVTVKMTRQQREHYATEYSMDGGVADDIASRLPEDIRDALGQVYWLREFASYSVSKAR